jgi:hypothetical protein
LQAIDYETKTSPHISDKKQLLPTRLHEIILKRKNIPAHSFLHNMNDGFLLNLMFAVLKKIITGAEISQIYV